MYEDEKPKEFKVPGIKGEIILLEGAFWKIINIHYIFVIIKKGYIVKSRVTPRFNFKYC